MNGVSISYKKWDTASEVQECMSHVRNPNSLSSQWNKLFPCLFTNVRRKIKRLLKAKSWVKKKNNKKKQQKKNNEKQTDISKKKLPFFQNAESKPPWLNFLYLVLCFHL